MKQVFISGMGTGSQELEFVIETTPKFQRHGGDTSRTPLVLSWNLVLDECLADLGEDLGNQSVPLGGSQALCMFGWFQRKSKQWVHGATRKSLTGKKALSKDEWCLEAE